MDEAFIERSIAKMEILDVIFWDTVPHSVSKIKEGKGKPFPRFIGLVLSKLKQITL